MTYVLEATNLGKTYGRHQALTDVSLHIPPGRVVGLVGPNGAGKSTLLGLTSGLVKPTHGTLSVLGAPPAANAAQLARVGFVAQDTPVYATLTVAEHLRLGQRLNPTWDMRLAQDRITQLGLDPTHKAGRLSGGQRAQLALALAAAKRPELLIFDEPVAALDPLARRGFLQNLMEAVAELDASVILSSHLLGDLERVCDYLVVLGNGHLQLAGEADDLVAHHYRLIGTPGDFDHLPPTLNVITAEHTTRQSTLIVHTTHPIPHTLPGAHHLDLEDIILAYMSRTTPLPTPTHHTPQPKEARR